MIPNATGAAVFAGMIVDDSASKISSDPSSNWSISTTMTAHGDPSGQQLIGAPQDGDACFSASCSEALSREYTAGAMRTAAQIRQISASFDDEFGACQNLVHLKAPDECKGSSTDGSRGGVISTGMASAPYIFYSFFPLSPLFRGLCRVAGMSLLLRNLLLLHDLPSSAPFEPQLGIKLYTVEATIPRALAGPSYAAETTKDFATYDGILSRSVPFIIVMWSNSTTITAMGGKAPAEPWADMRIGCVRPGTVRAGSRGANAASGGQILLWA